MKHPTRLITATLVLLALSGAFGYADLRTRIDELREERSSQHQGVERAVEPATVPPPPAVAQWRCDGVIPRSSLARVVGTHGQVVYQCREQAQATGRHIAGLINLHLRVEASGQVTATRLSGSITDSQFTNCVANAALAWRFEPLQTGECAEALVPFAFRDDDAPSE